MMNAVGKAINEFYVREYKPCLKGLSLYKSLLHRPPVSHSTGVGDHTLPAFNEGKVKSV